MPLISKLSIYVLGSLSLAGMIVYQNVLQGNVPLSLAITRLANSKYHKAVMLNAIFAIVLGTITSVIKFFFGEMREMERYDIIQSTKQKILSFAFIMLTLHDELVTSQLIILCIGVLAWSILHWLTIKRSEYLIMENQSNYAGHIKISILFCSLIVGDLLLSMLFYQNAFQRKDVPRSERHLAALIGFEVFILLLKIGSPCVKYFVNLVELLTLSHFEKKSTILSVVEFVFSVTTLLCELSLFIFIYQSFGIPLHLILETLETVSNLIGTVTTFYNSIVLVKKLNKLPEVTQEDVENIDSTCLICLHEITHGKKIPCGHIFHLNCLKGWIQGNANQFCPKCKQPIKIESTTDGQEPKTNVLTDIFQNEAQNVNKKIEKLHELNFGLDNLKIMELYNGILLNYLENGESQIEEATHQEIIKRIFTDVLTASESTKAALGAVEFGLPRPAVSYRTSEVEDLRKKIKLINSLVLSQYGNHAFFKLVPSKKADPVLEKQKEEQKQSEINVPENNPVSNVTDLNKPARKDLSSLFQKESAQDKNSATIVEEKGPINLGENKPNEEPVEINAEAEEIRRRRLLLEAAEKRANPTI